MSATADRRVHIDRKDFGKWLPGKVYINPAPDIGDTIVRTSEHEETKAEIQCLRR